MKKILKTLSKRREGRKLLIEGNNNEHTQDGWERGCCGYDNPQAQNAFNTTTERLQRDEDSFLSSSGHDLSQQVTSLHFPLPPADLDQNLQQHLETVLAMLVRLRPLPAPCHRQLFEHLHVLLQKVSSSKNCFLLMTWVLQTYVSQEELGRPDGGPYSEWEAKAAVRLLASVKKDVRDSLDKILQAERGLGLCKSEEAYVGLYVDTIQCIAAMPREAQKISPELCESVQEVCFQELLQFVKRYRTQHADVLGQIAEMQHPQTIYFLKTLKTCKELKQHVHSKSRDIKLSLLKEIVGILEDIEHFTLKFLMEIVADIAERHLKDYFKADKCWSILSDDLEKHFPRLRYVQDEQKTVMDEAYQIIAHTYLTHLLQRSPTKLRRHWSQDIRLRVADDADKLHNTISGLAPGVQRFELLKSVSEVLDCKSTDALKLVAASIQMNCCRKSEDLQLLHDLLRWKGLNMWRVNEVLDALPGGPSARRPALWSCCLPCC